MDYSSPKESKARDARLDQHADLICELAARVAALEKKLAALEAQPVYPNWTPTINGHVAPKHSAE